MNSIGKGALRYGGSSNKLVDANYEYAMDRGGFR